VCFFVGSLEKTKGEYKLYELAKELHPESLKKKNQKLGIRVHNAKFMRTYTIKNRRHRSMYEDGGGGSANCSWITRKNIGMEAKKYLEEKLKVLETCNGF